MADGRVLDAVALAQRQRLREVARRYLHLVAVRAHPVDQRAEDQDVRAVGEAYPDAHAAMTSSIARSSSSGPIGSARCVRAASAVPGSTAAGGKPAIAGC